MYAYDVGEYQDVVPIKDWGRVEGEEKLLRGTRESHNDDFQRRMNLGNKWREMETLQEM